LRLSRITAAFFQPPLLWKRAKNRLQRSQIFIDHDAKKKRPAPSERYLFGEDCRSSGCTALGAAPSAADSTKASFIPSQEQSGVRPRSAALAVCPTIPAVDRRSIRSPVAGGSPLLTAAVVSRALLTNSRSLCSTNRCFRQ